MDRRQPRAPARTRLTKRESEPDLSPRALGAMAEAVRRSREASTAISPPAGSSRPPVAHRPPVGPEGRHQRRLVAWVAVVVSVLVVAAGALGVSLVAHGGSPPSRLSTHAGTAPGTGTGHRSPPSSAPSSKTPSSTGASGGGQSGPPPSIATSTTMATAGTAPDLSTLSPSSGPAGQALVLSGTGFLSADGEIQARFDGQAAPTQCPDQTTCTVTVPSLSNPPPTVLVTITTASGTSNALSFVYQASSAGAPAQYTSTSTPPAGGRSPGAAHHHGRHHETSAPPPSGAAKGLR